MLAASIAIGPDRSQFFRVGDGRRAVIAARLMRPECIWPAKSDAEEIAPGAYSTKNRFDLSPSHALAGLHRADGGVYLRLGGAAQHRPAEKLLAQVGAIEREA
jgi:hypothetical protein